MINSAIGTYRTTQVQKANMESALQTVEQGYRILLTETENMTPKARAERAQMILEHTQSLRRSVNGQYIAGQQKTVDSVNGALDIIEQAMENYIMNGYRATYDAAQTTYDAAQVTQGYMLPGAGSTGLLPKAGEAPQGPTDTGLAQQMELGLQNALAQGMAQAPAEQTGTLAAGAAQGAVQTPAAPQGIQMPGEAPDAQELPAAQRLEALGETPERAQKLARDIDALLKGTLTDGNAMMELVNNKAAQQVMRQMMARQAQPDTMPQQTAATESRSAVPQKPAAEVSGIMLPTARNLGNRENLEGGMNDGAEREGGAAADGWTVQLPDGNGGWDAGESAGGQSGILAEGGPQRAIDSRRAAVDRQNRAGALRLPKVSSRELGLENGTDAQTLRVLPESAWDEELRQTAQRITRETGKGVTMVLGSIRIEGAGGRTMSVRGVYSGTGIIIQADNTRATPGQIADHEIFHDYAANNPGLIQAVERAIVERYSQEEFNGIMKKYMQALRGIVDVPESAMSDEFEDALADVKNEVFADAYAGINAFGAHAERYRDTVRDTLEERGIAKPERETAAATERRSGPPEQYSIGEIVGDDQKEYGIGVHLDSTLLENLTDSERVQMVKERVKELGGQHFTAYDNNGNEVDVKIAEPQAQFVNKSGKNVPVNRDLTTKNRYSRIKQESVVLADELITTAKHKGDAPARYPHGWLDNNGKNDWAKWTTYIQDKENTVWEATLHIATSADGEKILYDIDPIKKVGPRGNSRISLLSTGQPVKSGTSTVSTSIREDGGNVNRKISPKAAESDEVPQAQLKTYAEVEAEREKYSVDDEAALTEDSEGRELTEAQREFFKDSMVRDEDGRLKPVYHATYDDFTVFDRGKLGTNTDGNATDETFAATAHIGFWFSSRNLNESAGLGSRAMEAYLNIQDPYELRDIEALTAALSEYEGTPNERGEDFARWLRRQGYDGIILQDEEFGGTSYVALDPTQIKNVTNQNPTNDPDIRYSVDEDSLEPKQETQKPAQKEKKPRKAKTTKPVAESRPIIAKKDFRQNMLNLFSIPAGMRAQLGGYADACSLGCACHGDCIHLHDGKNACPARQRGRADVFLPEKHRKCNVGLSKVQEKKKETRSACNSAS